MGSKKTAFIFQKIFHNAYLIYKKYSSRPVTQIEFNVKIFYYLVGIKKI